jgi:putative nucleotidyltransferase with HDIG domain
MPEYLEVDEKNRHAQSVLKVQQLPSAPQIVFKLINEMGDANCNVANLARLVEGGPALASKVLGLANSAYYSLPHRITTISHALVVMGFEELRLLALGVGLARLAETRNLPRDWDGQGFWLHSLATSWLARELAKTTRLTNPDEAMIAGLVHDLGKLIVAAYLSDEFCRMMELVHDGHPYFQAERELGLPHTQVGFWLARKWNLPQLHTLVIKCHHALVLDQPWAGVVALIMVANKLSKALGCGLVQPAAPLDLAKVMSLAGLAPAQVKAIADRAAKELPPLLATWQNVFS